jgi:hypothetical protein
MTDETAKQTMLMVAEDCDSFAVRAAMRSFDKLFDRVIGEIDGTSDAPTMLFLGVSESTDAIWLVGAAPEKLLTSGPPNGSS